ncbi:MAG: hypothetical protein AUJ98_11905 [Bacteroidetes bacterium CG2_30_33_31]|nr:MAG: hypothetical protein AUJ98_11905 [Bacteroidetes bacterium CG2_30_33_31]
MNSIKIFLLLAFLSSFSISSFSQKPNITTNLDAVWKFGKMNDSLLYPAKVPGNVHKDLQRNALIENPYFGTNENEIHWVEKTDWRYLGHFEISKQIFDYKHIEIIFEGLDTYADVYINDKKILSSENMFVEYKHEIQKLINLGINKIEVIFKSPITTALPLWQKAGITYPADNDKSEEHLSVFTRKTASHYGWDWAPRFVTSGIWRQVKLFAWDDLKIVNVHITQSQLNNNSAKLKIYYNIYADRSIKTTLNIDCDKIKTFTKEIDLVKGDNNQEFEINIDSPKLWWPNGMGEQNIYTINSSLIFKGKIQDSKANKVGLRRLEVVNEKDSLGESFYLKVNGKAVFMKGANYIPSNCFPAEFSDSIYQKIFENAVKSNMNMLRVWGGGFYEDDKFYELADEKGIIIWQDFMFSCSMYPSDSEFIANILEEVEYNIKRLRNHACLALWCGNNEVNVGWENWGWQKTYHYDEATQKLMVEGYKKIFLELLPQKVQQLDSGRFYFPSSPISNWGLKSDFNIGDNHYWGVWWGKKPFESFNEFIARFMSEFGFQSFPEIKTLATFADKKDWQIDSAPMKAHQKSSIGNATIGEYMAREYKTPKNFEDFVYLSQLLQAEAMRIAFEAHRRNKPFCMGSLYWQFNDVWPAISWSGIDYFGNWKAMQYFVKKAFEPVICSAVLKNDSLRINIISDLNHPQKVKCKFTILTLDGKIIWQKTLETSLKDNANELILNDLLEKYIGKNTTNNIVLMMNLAYDSCNLVSDFLFDKVKNLQLQKPDIKIKIVENFDGYSVKLRSDVFVKNLQLESDNEGFWTDNFFDLIPSKDYEIRFITVDKSKDFSKNLKLKSVWDCLW